MNDVEECVRLLCECDYFLWSWLFKDIWFYISWKRMHSTLLNFNALLIIYKLLLDLK